MTKKETVHEELALYIVLQQRIEHSVDLKDATY